MTAIESRTQRPPCIIAEAHSAVCRLGTLSIQVLCRIRNGHSTVYYSLSYWIQGYLVPREQILTMTRRSRRVLYMSKSKGKQRRRARTRPAQRLESGDGASLSDAEVRRGADAMGNLVASDAVI